MPSTRLSLNRKNRGIWCSWCIFPPAFLIGGMKTRVLPWCVTPKEEKKGKIRGTIFPLEQKSAFFSLDSRDFCESHNTPWRSIFYCVTSKWQKPTVTTVYCYYRNLLSCWDWALGFFWDQLAAAGWRVRQAEEGKILLLLKMFGDPSRVKKCQIKKV